MLAAYIYLKNDKLKYALNSLITNNTWFLIGLTSAIFALAHLGNYAEIHLKNMLKIILRLSGGVYLGYVVSKYGVGYSILMHSFNNIIPFVILLI